MAIHMNLIANICRFALKDAPSKDLMKAVIKFRDALQKDGLDVESRALSSLIDKVEETASAKLQRKDIVWSKAGFSEGGVLSPSTPLPVDRETGTPLASVSFPSTYSEFDQYHFFDSDVTLAISGIVKEWQFADKLKEKGISPSYNCLFFGLPGTGKTELAKYLAYKLGLPLLTARLDSLLSSYLGTSARNISTLFDFADKYQCVLLLDEFDAIAKYRDDNKEVGEIKRVVNTLLQRLDIRQGRGVVIATTNHESLLDPAVWRRFQNRILISPPSYDVRKKIISAYIAPLELLENEKEFLCLILDGATPSEIKNCINFVKRFTVVNEEDSVNLYKAVKAYFVVNANNQTALSICMADDNEHNLAELLVNKYNYSIQDVSNLIGKHKSTISRWLKG